ncbi:MAG: DUF5320 domain-containing protein [Candidatus Woesearchaeota archaeon]
MPNRDGTGPRGLGTMTGRGKGPCGCGQRRGFGGGYGYRFGRIMTMTAPEQKNILEAELKEIESQKQAIEARLEDLK